MLHNCTRRRLFSLSTSVLCLWHCPAKDMLDCLLDWSINLIEVRTLQITVNRTGCCRCIRICKTLFTFFHQKLTDILLTFCENDLFICTLESVVLHKPAEKAISILYQQQWLPGRLTPRNSSSLFDSHPVFQCNSRIPNHFYGSTRENAAVSASATALSSGPTSSSEAATTAAVGSASCPRSVSRSWLPVRIRTAKPSSTATSLSELWTAAWSTTAIESAPATAWLWRCVLRLIDRLVSFTI